MKKNWYPEKHSPQIWGKTAGLRLKSGLDQEGRGKDRRPLGSFCYLFRFERSRWKTRSFLHGSVYQPTLHVDIHVPQTTTTWTPENRPYVNTPVCWCERLNLNRCGFSLVVSALFALKSEMELPLCASSCTRFFSVFSGVGSSSLVPRFWVGCSA